MKRYVYILLVVSLISGCAAQYKPIPDGYSGPTATIEDTKEREGDYKARFFVVTEIDDQPDGDEGTETDEEWLKKVAKDVAVEKLHAGGESMKRGANGFAKRKRGNGLGDLV